ncbi:MAG: response regulator transcription factor [Flavobacteriales bacterium]|nr:response regulator transcription factor [Flavobacteriales bacterium]MCC6938042.1 response regulator transcription factor [Flavobacteriales bacterium]
MPIVRILIADPLAVVVDGVRSWLSGEKDLRISGHARTGNDLLGVLRHTPCELVLLEVALPGMDGIDTMRALHSSHPTVRVLAFSALTDIEYVNSMLIEGAWGYYVKSGTKEELVRAIREVMRGRKYLSPDAQRSVDQGYAYTAKRPDGEYVGLTLREREIIRMIALERTNSEIGTALNISEATVKSHRKRLMTKLNVRSIAGLVKYAVDRRWA